MNNDVASRSRSVKLDDNTNGGRDGGGYSRCTIGMRYGMIFFVMQTGIMTMLLIKARCEIVLCLCSKFDNDG